MGGRAGWGLHIAASRFWPQYPPPWGGGGQGEAARDAAGLTLSANGTEEQLAALGQRKEAAEVKGGLLRSGGFLFLGGWGGEWPQREEGVGMPQVHAGMLSAWGMWKTRAAAVGRAPPF